jgi:hypothetical protein
MREREDNVKFIQFSHNLTDPNSKLREYYYHSYKKMVGYYAPEHYMEIPLWIAIISGMLPEELYKKTLMVISKEEEKCI